MYFLLLRTTATLPKYLRTQKYQDRCRDVVMERVYLLCSWTRGCVKWHKKGVRAWTRRSFGLLSSSIQASITPVHLLFVCNLVARPTGAQTGRDACVHGWMNGWIQWALFRMDRGFGGDVFALRFASFLNINKTAEDAHLDIFCSPLLCQDFKMLQAGTEVVI